MAKRPRNAFDALGIDAPAPTKDTMLSVRLRGEDVRKLDLIAKKLGVRGRSTIARLVLERFVAEHDPGKKGKG